MIFDAKITSITQETLIPKVTDNVLNSNVLTARLLTNSKEGKGYDVRKPVKIKNSGTATSFAGLDTFAASQLDTKQKMIFEFRGSRQPIAISGMDQIANSSADTKVDLVVEALEETQQELADFVGTELYGDGSGNSNKDFYGLGSTVDDGTNTTTIGQLSRTTYPVLNSTVTASGGTLSLAKIGSLVTTVSSGTLMQATTLLLGNKTVWDLYEQLLTPTVRASYENSGKQWIGAYGALTTQEALQGMQGFAAISFRGIPFVKDEKATSQTIFALNENYVNFYAWSTAKVEGYSDVKVASSKIEGIYNESPMDKISGFGWSGFRSSLNQFGTIGELLILGNLTTFQPRRHGKLTGVTGV